MEQKAEDIHVAIRQCKAILKHDGLTCKRRSLLDGGVSNLTVSPLGIDDQQPPTLPLST